MWIELFANVGTSGLFASKYKINIEFVTVDIKDDSLIMDAGLESETIYPISDNRILLHNRAYEGVIIRRSLRDGLPPISLSDDNKDNHVSTYLSYVSLENIEGEWKYSTGGLSGSSYYTDEPFINAVGDIRIRHMEV